MDVSRAIIDILIDEVVNKNGADDTDITENPAEVCRAEIVCHRLYRENEENALGAGEESTEDALNELCEDLKEAAESTDGVMEVIEACHETPEATSESLEQVLKTDWFLEYLRTR